MSTIKLAQSTPPGQVQHLTTSSELITRDEATYSAEAELELEGFVEILFLYHTDLHIPGHIVAVAARIVADVVHTVVVAVAAAAAVAAGSPDYSSGSSGPECSDNSDPAGSFDLAVQILGYTAAVEAAAYPSVVVGYLCLPSWPPE